MLLNCFAQPTLLDEHKTYLSFKEFQEAPLLLCHKNALDAKLLPIGWRGNMYATPEILNEVKQKNYEITPNSTQALYPNEVYTINITNDDYQYKAKNIEITVIPWNKECVMYLIKADNVTNLLTDMITEDMEVFLLNKVLRKSIKSGIDVLYVNNGVYHNSTELKDYPSECLLGALVTLVRPRYVQGLLGDQQLPQHILNCCADL